MCGIIAASSKNPIDFQDIKLGMLLADDRGGHATGLTLGRNNKIYKSNTDVSDFFDSFKKEDKEFLNGVEANTFIGHTRWATAGSRTIRNTHPFNFTNALGVHNGTIENFKELNKEYEDKALEAYKKKNKGQETIEKMTKIESDSLLVFYMIDAFGLEDTLKQLKGSMSLLWYDADNYLHIYRYDKPLCYGKKGDTIWIASLKDYLDVLGCTGIKQFTEHAHFIIKDGVVESGEELANKYKPEKKDSKYVDKDSQFESCSVTKKTKTTTKKKTKTTTKKEKTKRKDKPKVIKNETPVFKLPENSKHGITSGGDLVLYTFSISDYNVVYLDVYGFDDVMECDLSDKKEREFLESDFPELFNLIMEDHKNIKEGNRLRNEYKKDAV